MHVTVQPTYKLIKGYSVTYYAGAQNINKYPYRAVIHLFEEKASGYLGCAYFHRDKETMPHTDDIKADGEISFHFPAELFTTVLDLLRNEKPVFLNFNNKKWCIASLNTAREPAGEGELSMST